MSWYYLLIHSSPPTLDCQLGYFSHPTPPPSWQNGQLLAPFDHLSPPPPPLNTSYSILPSSLHLLLITTILRPLSSNPLSNQNHSQQHVQSKPFPTTYRQYSIKNIPTFSPIKTIFPLPTTNMPNQNHSNQNHSMLNQSHILQIPPNKYARSKPLQQHAQSKPFPHSPIAQSKPSNSLLFTTSNYHSLVSPTPWFIFWFIFPSSWYQTPSICFIIHCLTLLNKPSLLFSIRSSSTFLFRDNSNPWHADLLGGTWTINNHPCFPSLSPSFLTSHHQSILPHCRPLLRCLTGTNLPVVSLASF